jgi:hypothetical protein
MAKKSIHAKGTSFSVEISDFIRHHVGEAARLESQRSNAFDARNAAKEELDEVDDMQGEEAVAIKARHSDAVIEIESLERRIKWHNKQVDQAVRNPDSIQMELEYEVPDDVLHPPKKQPRAKGDDDKDQQKLSDGTAADEVPQGMNQHLRAAIAELQLETKTEKCLIQAGFNTVADVVKAIDSPEGLPDIRGIGGVGQAEIQKAVKKFRKAHQKAELEAERDQMAAAGA